MSEDTAGQNNFKKSALIFFKTLCIGFVRTKTVLKKS